MAIYMYKQKLELSLIMMSICHKFLLNDLKTRGGESVRSWNQPGFLLKETLWDFDGARTHDLDITSQTCNPLHHAAP